MKVIDPKELRMGNWVDYLGETAQVEWVKSGIIKAGFFQAPPEEFNPIPLTEEWLKRFGFEFDTETDTWTLLTSLEFSDYAFELIEAAGDFRLVENTRIIQHVHQSLLPLFSSFANWFMSISLPSKNITG